MNTKVKLLSLTCCLYILHLVHYIAKTGIFSNIVNNNVYNGEVDDVDYNDGSTTGRKISIEKEEDVTIDNVVPPLEKAYDIIALYHQATREHTPKKCQMENSTSLETTAALFSMEKPILPHHEDGRKISSQHAPIVVGTSISFQLVTLVFRAYDLHTMPRTMGGDEFVITVWFWSTAIPGTIPATKLGNGKVDETTTIKFKTAVVAHDMQNGTYSAIIKVPQGCPITSYNVTLMHYYTCYDGFKQYVRSLGDKHKYSSLPQFGPVTVNPHVAFDDFLLQTPTKDELTTLTETVNNKTPLPPPPLEQCDASQKGMDQLTNGIWVEYGGTTSTEISMLAEWTPLSCRIPKPTYTGTKYRIGDSTMPRLTIEIGDPFHHSAHETNRKTLFRDRWTDYLWNVLPNGRVDDVLAFSGGLHQLLKGYNAETSAVLLIRMVCQIGLRFKGNIVVIGPLPIQQQRNSRTDMRDGNILLLNAILRQTLLGTTTSSGGASLGNLCKAGANDTSIFDNLPTTYGTSMSRAATTNTFHRIHRHRNTTRQETNLIKYIKRLTTDEIDNFYGDRTVLFAEVHNVIRPRPETYDENDKVHDTIEDKYGRTLMYGKHQQLIRDLINLRAMASP